ncbi:hypothetical protein RB195_017330 [Necator americanus]|uniref:Reverse transcriptase domain-containing protein n=1 Tax=Necator americanus TaxID=51031 RepID=A0ABR1C5R6_NECAM
MDKLSSAGYRSSTSSTSLTKLENILDDNCEGTKQVEEMLGPVRPVKTDYPSMCGLRLNFKKTEYMTDFVNDTGITRADGVHLPTVLNAFVSWSYPTVAL